MENNPLTEQVPAPETKPAEPVTPKQEWILPRHKTIERQGNRAEPYTQRHPQVRGGICEFCGVMDKNVASEHQYKICPHYRGMQLRCSYCDENKNPDEVVYHAVLNVAEHPDNPNSLIVWCDSYDCSRKHEQRFKR